MLIISLYEGLLQLNAPCIVLYYIESQLLEVACGSRRDAVFLVFEYCEHDLSTLLEKNLNPFTEAGGIKIQDYMHLYLLME